MSSNVIDKTNIAMWRVDPAHTTVEFEIKHMRISVVKGHFTDVEGVIVGDLSNPTDAMISVRIPAATIDSGYPQRDVHLRSADFLDCEHYPTISFKSTAIEPIGEGNYSVRGTLELRGISREITLIGSIDGEAVNYVGEQVLGLTAKASISPSEFDVSWNVPLPGGSLLIGDTARIELHVEAVRQA